MAQPNKSFVGEACQAGLRGRALKSVATPSLVLMRAAALSACASGGDSLADLTIEEFEPPRVVACDDTAAPLPIASFPAGGALYFFQHVDSKCPLLPSTAISLVNASGESVLIDAISVNQPFRVARVRLPVELAPEERLPLKVLFAPESVGQTSSAITVASGQRCARIELGGWGLSATEGRFLSYSALALDFGVVPVGSQPSRDIVFMNQTARTDSARKDWSVGGFGTTSSLFTLGSHEDPLRLAECSPERLPVTFHAGTSSGVVSARLVWESFSSADGNTFVGAQSIDLVATVK